MSKQIIKYVLLLTGVAILALLQFSFISALPWPINNFNLSLVAIIFSLLFLDKKDSWVIAISLGFFTDAWLFHPYGTAILSFFLTAVALYLILENLLTNRSLYSFLLLTIIAVLIDTIFTRVFLIIFDWSGAGASHFLVSNLFWGSLMWNLILSLLVVGFIFSVLAILSRRLKPFFLKRR
ncbi:MAG: hypothetical protein PHE20_01025 [Patescibacteria group bacterium]|nr:hypothetical protein [Patescibacteria group bacterium]